MSISESLAETLEGLNIDLNIDDFTMDEEDELLVTNQDVASANMRLNKLKAKFGETHFTIVPKWILFNFNPYTLEPLKKKVITNFNLKKTPDELVREMIMIANQDESYRKKLESLLAVQGDEDRSKSQVFQATLELPDPSTGLLINEDAVRAFEKFTNIYTVQDVVQSYKTGEDRGIKRAAVLATKDGCFVDRDKSDPRLLVCRDAEINLVNYLVNEIEVNKKPTDLDTDIKQRKRDIYSNKLMSDPMIASFALLWAVPCDSAGVISKEDRERLSAPTCKVMYDMKYFAVNTEVLKKLSDASKKTDSKTLNYSPMIISFPVESEKCSNIGQAVIGAQYVQQNAKYPIERQVPTLSDKLSQAMKEEKIFEPGGFKKYIREFTKLSVEEVINLYVNGMTRYSLALKDPKVREENKEFLKLTNSNLALSVVEKSVEQPIIDVEYKTTEELISNTVGEEVDLNDDTDEDDSPASSILEGATANDFVTK